MPDAAAPDPALEAAYRATSYLVHLPGTGAVSIRVDGPLPDRLTGLAGDAPWAFLTAWNPGSIPQSRPANEAAMASLQARLKITPGLRVFHGTGHTDRNTGRPGAAWQPEPSLWVVGITEADALALAAEYGQRAIVVGEGTGPARLAWCP